jgi:DNA-binding NarL/FixJ family response regulator
MSRIAILIAEDHTIVREGLCILLGQDPDLEVIAQAGNGREAVALARQHQPDVIVMDIAMPLLNGLEATRQILRARPAAKVIILSAHSDDAYVEQALAYGASGFLVKQTAANHLSKAIRQVHRGATCFTPDVFKRLSRHSPAALHRRESKTPDPPIRLSSRETEVLQLIAEGKTNKETADELHISVKTVEKHRHTLMQKLDIHDTASLTRHAIETGIVESSIQRTTTAAETAE